MGAETVLGRVTAEPRDGWPIYPIREDSELLREFAIAVAGERVAEVGCGRGEVALALAGQGASTVATDLNPYALRWVRSEARRRSVEVNAVRVDLLSGLCRFGRIFANPPYLPTSDASKDPEYWNDVAVNGGRDGARTTVRLIDQLIDHLVPGGSAWILVSSRQDLTAREAARSRFRRHGGDVEVVGRRDLAGEQLWVERFRTRRSEDQPAD